MLRQPKAGRGRVTLDDIKKLDTVTSERLRVHDGNRIWKALAMVTAHTGDLWVLLPLLGLLWLLEKGAWRRFALVQAAFIFVTAAAVFLIKYAIRRRRPDGEFGSIYRLLDPHSFPSGHAARAVGMAVLSAPLVPVWAIPLLAVWVLGVGISRVALRLHYVLDILAGYGMGTAIGVAILGFNAL